MKTSTVLRSHIPRGNLFYPKNDCEDRAIFYTYLLWEVLGIPNQLICYPGHESASVSLSTPVKGISYSHSGKTFYISDPTYIGSVTGQCMPDFEQTAPEIDFTYNNPLGYITPLKRPTKLIYA